MNINCVVGTDSFQNARHRTLQEPVRNHASQRVFDEATWQFFSHWGLPRSRFLGEGTGIEYKRELHAGDLISIRSAVLEVKEKSIRFAHEMANDETGDLAARTILVGVYFDTMARKSLALPMDVRERAQLLIVPSPM